VFRCGCRSCGATPGCSSWTWPTSGSLCSHYDHHDPAPSIRPRSTHDRQWRLSRLWASKLRPRRGSRRAPS